MEPQRPSMRLIAEKAGVSCASVSMALRNDPRIRVETRERIQQVARELGYRQNPVMAKLYSQLRLTKKVAYQSTLGLIYFGAHRNFISESHTFRDWIEGVEERAKVLGYKLDRFYLPEPGLTLKRFAQILFHRSIGGLILFGEFSGDRIPPEYDSIWNDFCTVVIGNVSRFPAFSCVTNDQYSTSYDCVLELAKLGYRRPGLCIPSAVDDRVGNRFSAGFRAAHRKLGLEQPLPAFDYCPEREEDFLKWLSNHRPDVILTTEMGAKAWAESAGIIIPKDIGLVNLDYVDDANEWAGMCQNNTSIGAAAVDLVAGQLSRHELGIPMLQKSVLITSQWKPGRTVRPL